MSSLNSDITDPGIPQLTEVSSGIYAYIQPGGTWWINNTGFLTGPQGVISIDIFNGGTPFLLMGSIAGAIEVLENVVKPLDAEIIVPGHGQIFAGSAPIDDTLDYIRFVAEVAASGIRTGLSPLDAAREADLGRFSGWADAEHEGAPPGAPIDVVQALSDMVTYNGGAPLTCVA